MREKSRDVKRVQEGGGVKRVEMWKESRDVKRVEVSVWT